MDILHANDYMMAQTHIRLFHRLFYKVSLFYATNVPRTLRRIIDRIMMVQTGVCIFLLLYVHQAFLSRSGTCLDSLVDTWPKDGIVRVQVNTTKTFYSLPLEQEILYEEERYIMEYSLHYSFLRMDDALRNNLSIPVTNFTVEKHDPCFGNLFSRFLLENLFGYDDVLMSSFKKVASNVSNKGFLRNVITGEHYRFIDMWINKLNYILSFVLMIVLTSVIAMLMRLCHHQLFKFFCKLLFALQQNQVLYPVWMPFPIASLLTMFLGLWGLETIMTELLDDPMVSFHLIAFVWMADNYYTICCHSYLSRKYFPRFFYLSSYLFYGFHSQFNGQFSGLALVTTFMTTQLCMVYFYHKYEIPIIELFITRTRREQQHANPLTVEAMVTSLVQLQQNGYVSLEPYIPTLERRVFDLSHYQHMLRSRWMVMWRHISRYHQVSRYLQLVGIEPLPPHEENNQYMMPEVVEDPDRSQDTTSEGTEDQDTTTSSDPYLDISPIHRQSSSSSLLGGLRRRETTLSEELANSQSVSEPELNVDNDNAEYYL